MFWLGVEQFNGNDMDNDMSWQALSRTVIWWERHGHWRDFFPVHYHFYKTVKKLNWGQYAVSSNQCKLDVLYIFFWCFCCDSTDFNGIFPCKNHVTEVDPSPLIHNLGALVGNQNFWVGSMAMSNLKWNHVKNNLNHNKKALEMLS